MRNNVKYDDSKKITHISIHSMLMGEFTTPVFPSNRLELIGKFLGVPDRWDFGIEDEFIGQLGYGDFELTLQTQANRVEIERIWIELWDTAGDRPKPKTSRIRLAKHLQVDLGRFEPGLNLTSVKETLDLLGMSYREFDPKESSEVVRRLYLPTNAELYFFQGEKEPILMEIHFLSKVVD